MEKSCIVDTKSSPVVVDLIESSQRSGFVDSRSKRLGSYQAKPKASKTGQQYELSERKRGKMEEVKSFEFIYLTQEEVMDTGVDMVSFIQIEEQHFRLRDEGKIILPSKVVLDLGEREKGRINALPAYVGGGIDVCGIKWVASFPHNPQRYHIPRANAFIILNDSHTGVPLVIMDGTYISAMRTGAVTGVGVKYLARKDSEIIAMIGCGVQARTQLLALKVVLPNITEVRCFDANKKTSEKYAEEMSQETGLNSKAVSSAQEAVAGADVIVTVTVANEPIVKNRFVTEGSLFVHVGSYQEEEEEVVLGSDKIVVDDWESVYHRRTPILATMYDQGKLESSDIYANLGEVVNGKKAGRETDYERIFFLPIGMGSEDVIAAYQVYKMAREKGLGRSLRMWSKFALEGDSHD